MDRSYLLAIMLACSLAGCGDKANHKATGDAAMLPDPGQQVQTKNVVTVADTNTTSSSFNDGPTDTLSGVYDPTAPQSAAQARPATISTVVTTTQTVATTTATAGATTDNEMVSSGFNKKP